MPRAQRDGTGRAPGDVRACAACGADLPEGARFCVACGQAAPAPDAPATGPDGGGAPLVVELGPEEPGPEPGSPPGQAPGTPPPPIERSEAGPVPPTGPAPGGALPPTAAAAPPPPPGHADPTTGWGGPPPPGVPAGAPGWPTAAQPGRRAVWPLAPLTVPVALLLATLVYGVISNNVLAELGLDGYGGAFTSGATLALVLTGALLLLALVGRRPLRPVAALVSLLVTVVVVGAVSAVASESVGDGFFLPGRPGGPLENLPESLYVPYDALVGSYFSRDLLFFQVGDGAVSGTAVGAWALVSMVVGAGAALGASRRAVAALAAGAGGLVAGALGEGAFELLAAVAPDLVVVDGTLSPVVLLPVVVTGIGIGLGGLLSIRTDAGAGAGPWAGPVPGGGQPAGWSGAP